MGQTPRTARPPATPHVRGNTPKDPVKMAERIYTNPQSGKASYFPWGAAEAKRRNSTRYASETPCSKCGTLTPERFLRSHACQVCTLRDVGVLQRWARAGAFGDVPELSALVLYPTQEAPIAHTDRRPCNAGPHFQVLDSAAEACVNCAAERDAVAAPVGQINAAERQAAADRGDKRYDPGVPCKRGHTSLRFVANGGCVQCARPTARPAMTLDETIACLELVRSAPDMVMPRSDAAALGMGVFREDGQSWRYVSSGALVQP